jgi:hypothetical protein
MNPHSNSLPNPNRVLAGKQNRQRRGALTPDGRQRLRESMLTRKPWVNSTGPRTVAGKARSAENGKYHQTGQLSIRQRRAACAGVHDLILAMTAARRQADTASDEDGIGPMLDH